MPTNSIVLPFSRALATALLFSSVAFGQTTIAPIVLSQAAVACTDVEMDYTRLPAGITPENTWRGDGGVFADSLFVRAATPVSGPLLIAAKMPNNPSIFKRYPNQIISTPAIACYPTTANNPRPDYTLPNGQIVPRMQRLGDQPIFADASKRYPVLLLSHGLGGAPLDLDYLTVGKQFAAQGFVVVIPFHADQRFIQVKIGSFGDVASVVRDYPLIAEAMAIRPVVVSETLSYLLNHAAFKDHLDGNQIAGWGASLGGQSLMLNQGAKLTTSLGISSNNAEVVITDKRIKAFVGYVPYSGIDYGAFASVASFDSGNEGVRGIRTPYIAITGSADTTAPELQTKRMVRNLSGTNYHVSIAGLEHTFVPAHAPDIFTWSLLFYDAHLFGDAAARTKLASVQSVTGNAPDTVLSAVTQPWWFQDEVGVIEYYHAGLNHYFMTAIEGEKQYLDADPKLGWARTGQGFIAWRDTAATGAQVFRFYHDARGKGANTHFFTADAPEAAGLRKIPQDWLEEQSAWRAFTVGSACPQFTTPVTRAYNNRYQFLDSNHRFMTTAAIINNMKNANWIIEGNVMCVVVPAN